MGCEFAAGSRVSARGLTWDVLETVPLGAQTLLHLRCVQGDLAGLEWDLLHPADDVAPVRAGLRPDAPGPLSAWRLYHQACLLDQIPDGSGMVAAMPGRVRIEPYQLVPLLRVLEMPRARLLLADGVGLGKTVEAALIICELIARRRAHRVLVVAPAGPLLSQWVQELRQRFGLRFTPIADAASLQDQRRRLEIGGNPFDATALCITSLDFAKQERVLEELERSAWDLAVIDEAHHCIASGGVDREATQRRRLAEVVAGRSDGLLLLSATPHDGFDPHFASLLELLDPSLVDGRGGVVGTAYRRHVVRRLKSQVRDAATGAPLFRERQVMPVRVDVAHPAVRRFHAALAALIAPRLRREARGGERADALAFVSLLKRSVSTIDACVGTLRVVADRYGQPDTDALRRERARSLRTYRRRLLRYGVLDAAAESDVAELEADGMAADLRSYAADDLAKLLRTVPTAEALATLIGLGEAAAAYDPKLAALAHEIGTIRRARPGANVLVYTEYADSQAAALRALRGAVAGEVLAIDGTDGEAVRARITDRFAEEDGLVLVSTDTLAEGLNLQQRCCDLIHLDLPYNPNRLEQRNGRIDRYGQQHAPRIRYLYLDATFEERLLLRLIAKFEKARSHLHLMPTTLGVTADAADLDVGLVAGFAERQAGLFDDAPSPIRTLDREAEDAGAAAYRDLLHEIDVAFEGFERSAVRHGWLEDRALPPDAEPPPAVPCNPLPEAVDLPDFVAAAAGGVVVADTIAMADDWLAGLDDLPGVDRAAGELHFTRVPTGLRGALGRPLALLGRAHPLVRRAIDRVLRVADTPRDHRVSVARNVDGGMPSVLLTFAGELRCAGRIEVQHTIAVLLPLRGQAHEITEPAHWLGLGGANRGLPSDDVWHRLFATWVPRRLAKAQAVAETAMQLASERFAAGHRTRLEREADRLRDWLRQRADVICGAAVPYSGDLFGATQSGPLWRSLAAPLERLAAYAADAENTPVRRREASSVVELLQRRAQDRAARTDLSPPALRPLGMLMLVPCGPAA